MLSSRLESVQARHQREIKILTAARALQKLNGSNKRMSKQTMESLEQSEKKVEAAEKVSYSFLETIHRRRAFVKPWLIGPSCASRSRSIAAPTASRTLF